jgi:hypothetical protein
VAGCLPVRTERRFTIRRGRGAAGAAHPLSRSLIATVAFIEQNLAPQFHTILKPKIVKK